MAKAKPKTTKTAPKPRGNSFADIVANAKSESGDYLTLRQKSELLKRLNVDVGQFGDPKNYPEFPSLSGTNHPLLSNVTPTGSGPVNPSIPQVTLGNTAPTSFPKVAPEPPTSTAADQLIADKLLGTSAKAIPTSTYVDAVNKLAPDLLRTHPQLLTELQTAAANNITPAEFVNGAVKAVRTDPTLSQGVVARILESTPGSTPITSTARPVFGARLNPLEGAGSAVPLESPSSFSLAERLALPSSTGGQSASELQALLGREPQKPLFGGKPTAGGLFSSGESKAGNSFLDLIGGDGPLEVGDFTPDSGGDLPGRVIGNRWVGDHETVYGEGGKVIRGPITPEPTPTTGSLASRLSAPAEPIDPYIPAADPGGGIPPIEPPIGGGGGSGGGGGGGNGGGAGGGGSVPPGENPRGWWRRQFGQKAAPIAEEGAEGAGKALGGIKGFLGSQGFRYGVGGLVAGQVLGAGGHALGDKLLADNQYDQPGWDQADVGQFAGGFGDAASVLYPTLGWAGPWGIGAATLGSAAYGLYDAIWGGDAPGNTREKETNAANAYLATIPESDRAFWNAQFQNYVAAGHSPKEAQAAIAQAISQEALAARQAQQQQAQDNQFQVTPQQYMAIEQAYADQLKSATDRANIQGAAYANLANEFTRKPGVSPALGSIVNLQVQGNQADIANQGVNYLKLLQTAPLASALQTHLANANAGGKIISSLDAATQRRLVNQAATSIVPKDSYDPTAVPVSPF